MSFRVTQQTLSRNVLAGMQNNLSKLQDLQGQLSSGRRVSRPSDSPVDAIAAMQLRADQQRTEQYGRNIQDGVARLGSADGALTQVVSMLSRVRQLAVQGNNAANGPAELSAMADEVDSLRAGLITLANSSYLGRPLFAGTANVNAAFDATTGAYLGNTGQVKRQVSDDPTTGQLAVNVPGSSVFGTLLTDSADPGGLGVLQRLSRDLRAGDSTALGADLGDLDVGTEAVSTAHSLIGARYNRLQTVQQQSSAHLDAVAGSLSDAVDIDLPKTIVALQLQQNAYQAALGATAKIVQPSLLDFLR